MDKIYLIILLGLVLLVFFKIVVIWINKSWLRKPTYKAKGPYLLSKGEKAFFDVLVKAIPSSFYVCPKVRLADFIEVSLSKEDKNFWKAFNKISQKHVDFLICNKSTFGPKLVIELDGGSHNSKSRLERDAFVDNVLNQSNICIKHFKVSTSYNLTDLASQIRDLLQS